MALIVEFHSRPGCFASLPPAALVSSEQRPTVRVRTAAGRTVYLTCSGWTAPAGRLLLHRRLARCLSLSAGETVSVTEVRPPPCRRAVLRAHTDADYELLALSGARLQDGLLERAGCVWPGAALPVWLDARNVVSVTVVRAEPAECCLLVRMTELEIQPPAVEPAQPPTASDAAREMADDGETLVHRISRTLGLAPPRVEERPSADPEVPPPPPWTLRAHSLPPPEGLSSAETFISNRVCFCLAEDAPAGGLGWCELSCGSATGTGAPPPPAVILLLALDRLSERYSALWAAAEAGQVGRLAAAGAVLVPDVVRRQLRLRVSDPVTLRPLVPGRAVSQLTCVSEVRLEPAQLDTVRHHLTAWQRCLGDSADIWWRSGALLRLVDERSLRPFDVVLEADCAAVFRVPAPPSVELSATCLSSEYGSGGRPAWPLPVEDLPELALPPPPGPETAFTAYSAEQQRLESWLRRALTCPGLGHALLTGPQGVGKTTLALQAARCLSRAPLCAVVSLLDCSALLGKKAEAVLERLGRLLAEAERRQPAVVVLDSLDALAPPEQESSGEPSQRGAYFAQLSSALRRRLNALSEDGRRVAVVATGSGLHPALGRPAGLHVFGLELTLAAADSAGRVLQLRELSEGAPLDGEQWRRLADRCRGFTALDLRRLVTRARLAVGGGRLTEPALAAALDGLSPAALLEVHQSRPAPVTWGQVGGLHAVRRQLVAALQRPLLYPVLYARAGRHLQARALLYGPPGSGKTLLARALAHQADINFFTVKGPELLSKYIGASELAVRDLFERASRASPALIFFDEFESLAPRRGHDSTGVTDRVVNQLLTLLDGAETPAGGGQLALLAATSRPDLLDPALLRPGRLGRLLRCRLPDRRERVEILSALTAELTLAADVQLERLAERAGLSGADLRALVTDAHLRAVRDAAPPPELGAQSDSAGGRRWRLVDGPPLTPDETGVVDDHPALTAVTELNSSGEGTAGTVDQTAVVITQAHLEAALADLRPSLSPSEMAKYDAIYSQFERGRGGGDGAGEEQGTVGVGAIQKVAVLNGEGGGSEMGARQRVSLA
ncbi:peroxisome biogenesis factor 1-like [Amphibalanus amphitrite]|uniref:peroxisome biogenesis factor 1-like n=1 Tax=Amphibalanus amphitrite TaxID=1232801 RepID=UPI001C90BEAE|nr:peroxisome biogenesis factor 1-like [Amphibalanus amphitrite]